MKQVYLELGVFPVEDYIAPSSEVIELTPPQIICGSNESILPGDETNWSMGLDPFDGFPPMF